MDLWHVDKIASYDATQTNSYHFRLQHRYLAVLLVVLILLLFRTLLVDVTTGLLALTGLVGSAYNLGIAVWNVIELGNGKDKD